MCLVLFLLSTFLIPNFSLVLEGNYKLWDFASSKYLYDYSLKNRHAVMSSSNPSLRVFSDRGLYIIGGFQINLPSNIFAKSPATQDLILSSWIYLFENGRLFMVRDTRYSQAIYMLRIFVDFGSTYSNISYQREEKAEVWLYNNYSSDNLHGARWRFLVGRFQQVGNDTRFTMFVNTVEMFQFTINNFSIDQPTNTWTYATTGTTRALVYEIWWHSNMNSIADLEAIMKSSTFYISPHSLNLPTFSYTYNSSNQLCPVSCTTVYLSCNANLKCIGDSESSCYFNFLQSTTNQCILNCPNNSCTCTATNNFNCSCKVGYKKITDSPIACIDLHCEIYNKNGYTYTCTKCEEGYILNTDNTCKCDSGYIQKQSNPLKCAWDTFRCIEYIEGTSIYTCSKCQEGYKIDSLGRNCICDSGYKIFKDNPMKCGYEVLRCDNYIEGDSLFTCIGCIEGYSIDIIGKSCICAVGYVKVADNPIECTLEMLNCIHYVKRDDIWICEICSLGYRVDPYYKCLDCDVGYSVVSNNPFTCATEIYACAVYSLYNYSWICDQCAIGYRLGCEGKCCECDIKVGYIQVAQNPIVCIIEMDNCLEYKLYESRWGCGVCKEGYDINIDLRCNKCKDGYAEYSEDPLICISEIKNCETYTLLEQFHICLKCEEGYRMCQGKCCECSMGYYVPKNNPDICSECPPNCNKCKESDNDLICTYCNYGYTVIDDRCECDLEDFFYRGNSCVVKPFEVSLSYDYNSIIVSFSKKLANPLSDSDFIITFHEEFDMRLLIYEIIPIEDSKEYLISFRFFMNINQVFSMSITFSDKVVDRQNLALVTKTQYTSLPLEVEGITARNEFCDSSCLECEVINGRLGCSICYDYAFISEGVCKCYVEAIESSPKSCPAKCPENMEIDSDLRRCVTCKRCYEYSNQNQDTDQINTTKEISKQSEEYSGYSSNLSTASATTAFALGSAFGVDKVWSLMNTIQIYSYLPLISVDYPLHLQEALKSQDSSSKYFDYFKDLFPSDIEPSSKFSNFKYESSSFLRNSIKPITVACAIFILNILIYAINQVSRGNLKKHSGTALSFFNLSIYLRYFIQIYMDILIPCTLQLIYVMFI
jgi:hypothetical protein